MFVESFIQLVEDGNLLAIERGLVEDSGKEGSPKESSKKSMSTDPKSSIG